MIKFQSYQGLLSRYCTTLALKAVRSTARVPQHVSVVIDGNRRFARERGIPIAEGHGIGYDNVEKTVASFSSLGVPVVTVWLFSVNNFRRNPQEVKNIMKIIDDLMIRWIGPGGMAQERKLKIRVWGKTDLLDPERMRTFDKVMEVTKDYDRGTVNLLIPYNGTDDILKGINSVLRAPDTESMIVERIDQDLCTRDSPPLDILIRTGASRLSDFMNWQCNETTDIVFPECLWPEFSTWWILDVVLQWRERKKRDASTNVDKYRKKD